ncbi:MAG: DUF1819 family protein [Bacteroidetes bacterium]|nr:DUF1819 family protein [Bacteroidota bacterium]
MNQTITKYSASFTAGSLLLDEITRVLSFLLNDEIEEKRSEIINKNIIKINSESARKRVLQEIRKRNKSVDKSVWQMFESSVQAERKILMFYAVVKTYPLIADFMREVILNKWKSLKRDFEERDIEIFLDKKSTEHPEIEMWSKTTSAKVIQVIQRMLKESGLLTGNKLNSLEASNHFWRFFIQVDDLWFLELALLNKEQREIIIETL